MQNLEGINGRKAVRMQGGCDATLSIHVSSYNISGVVAKHYVLLLQNIRCAVVAEYWVLLLRNS
jgi:hypothetical protein